VQDVCQRSHLWLPLLNEEWVCALSSTKVWPTCVCLHLQVSARCQGAGRQAGML